MIIERIVSIPLNDRRKIDRKNIVPKKDIKELVSMEFNGNEIVSPTTDIEKRIYEVILYQNHLK
ncbi:MAG: hypothetical protein LBV42_04275 [Methanobrevibacter sp.]|nr:hypothetical protein [Methanobrevibacter sp.]